MKNLIYNHSPPYLYLYKKIDTMFRIYSVLDSNLLTNVYSYLPIRIELNKKSNMDYYIPYLKTGGLLYNRQLNLIRGLYRKLR